MPTAPSDVLILRDPRESTRKCSLTPLRGKPGVRFVAYHRDKHIEAGERVLLHPDGEPLSPADGGRGLLLVDCSWRRLDSLLITVDGDPPRRSLPELTTAYPRRSRPNARSASVIFFILSKTRVARAFFSNTI